MAEDKRDARPEGAQGVNPLSCGFKLFTDDDWEPSPEQLRIATAIQEREERIKRRGPVVLSEDELRELRRDVERRNLENRES